MGGATEIPEMWAVTKAPQSAEPGPCLALLMRDDVSVCVWTRSDGLVLSSVRKLDVNHALLAPSP